MLRERLGLERELEDLGLEEREYQAGGGAGAVKPPTVGFEFDINYGTEDEVLDAKGITWEPEWECTNLTDDSYPTTGFRVRTDGPRLELATTPFEVTKKGRTEADKVIKALVKFAKTRLEQECSKKGKAASVTSSRTGSPRVFTLKGGADWKAKSFSDLPIGPLGVPASFQSTCRTVAASPQATVTVSLSQVRELIRRVVATAGKGVGSALTGAKSQRLGLRSTAAWDAREAVRGSRLQHLKDKTALGGGKVVTDANYTEALEGFLILLVMYLRTSQLPYDHTPPAAGKRKAWDYEVFAKAYLPLNVKAPFYDIFTQLLNDDEREVFRKLYGAKSKRDDLYALAESDATKRSGSNMLFPARVKDHQELVFLHAPTWDEFVDSACQTAPVKKLVQERDWPSLCKHKKGDEVLFAPMSKIIGLDKTAPRVAIELRRVGFNWWGRNEWPALVDIVFKLMKGL